MKDEDGRNEGKLKRLGKAEHKHVHSVLL